MSSQPDFRFGGIGRLYGRSALDRFNAAHALVVGIGGVGSWAAEALARSGIGRLTLVDLDEVCVSNVNRQLHALESTLGRPKCDVMAERIAAINPAARVAALQEFFTPDSARRLLGLDPDGAEDRPSVVIDAIDNVPNKVHLIALCHQNGIPIVVCGGAGGRRNPTAVRILDLARVTHDRLLAEVRKRLRRDHGFPRNERRFGLDCICSAEPPVFPARDGTVCATRSAPAAPGESLRLNCDSGFGSATFVTGTFGFTAAAHALDLLLRP